MKALKLFLSLLLITLVMQQFLPWWIISIVAFVAAYTFNAGKLLSFLIGFVAIFLLWCAGAWFADRLFDVPVSGTIGKIFGGLSSFLIYFLTALIGGTVAGVSSLTGQLLYELKNK